MLKKFSLNYIINFLFSIIFLFIVYFWGKFWSQYGIDISDSGFFLHSQERILKNQATGISPSYLWIGSDFIGALWLNLNSNVSLHFAKMGAYFLYGIIMLIGYFTVFRITKDSFYSCKITLISYVFFGSLFIFPIINYDLAPLLPISLIFLLATFLTKTRIDVYIFFLFGVLSLIILFMRLPLVLFVLSFVLFFLFKYRSFYNFFYFLVGFFTTIIILKFIPITNNLLHLYFDTLIEFAKPIFLGTMKNPKLSLFESFNYTLKDQLFFWFRGYTRILFTSFFLFFIFFIYKNLGNKRIQFFFNIFLVSSILFISYFPLEKYNFFNSININVIQSQFIYNYILPSIIIITILYLFLEKCIYFDQVILVLFVFLLLPIGSNSFEKKISLTFFLVLPILYTLLRKIISTKNGFLILKDYIYWSLKIFSVPFFVLIFFKGLNSPYRDLPVDKLNTEFKSLSLKGIYSTKEKVEAIDPVVNWLLLNKKSNSSLLSIERTSIFNYLTGIPGVFDYPYPIYLSLNYFENHLLILKSSNQLPNFVIIPKVDISNPNWPIDKNLSTIPNDYKVFLIKFVNTNSYNLEFESDYFQIFKR